MKTNRIVILIMAIAAGLAAAYLVASHAPSRPAAPEDADYFCYELRQGWVCTYARLECEARLARETPADVKTRCTPHTTETLSP